LDISLIDRPWETTNLTGNGNATVADDDPNDSDEPIAPFLNNEQVCAIQKEGVDYKSIEQYYTVFDVLFFQSMDVRMTKDASDCWRRVPVSILTHRFFAEQRFHILTTDCLEERRPFVGRHCRGLFSRVAVHQECHLDVCLVLAHDGTLADADFAVVAPSRQIYPH
jgi:hypothetical protein